jgi:RimJ/RimL family protein N-acetyltransferase
MRHLTPLKHDHLGWLKEWRNNPDIMRWFRQDRLLTEESQETWFKSLSRLDVHFMMVESGSPYGYCCLKGIHPTHRSAEFSVFSTIPRPRNYYALKELFNHGFYDLGLHRIYSDVIEGNSALKLYKHMGFREEGRNVKIYWKEGAWVDSVNIAMLKEDYEAPSSRGR